MVGRSSSQIVLFSCPFVQFAPQSESGGLLCKLPPFSQEWVMIPLEKLRFDLNMEHGQTRFRDEKVVMQRLASIISILPNKPGSGIVVWRDAGITSLLSV